jgi:hypothetical protein
MIGVIRQNYRRVRLSPTTKEAIQRRYGNLPHALSCHHGLGIGTGFIDSKKERLAFASKMNIIYKQV